MADPTLIRSLLTLVTTPAKAEEIEGDLVEQATAHSRSWLRLQLAQTWFALAFAAFRKEPGHTLVLSYGIHELSQAISNSMVYPLRLYMLRETDLSMSVVTLVTVSCWALLGFCTGAASVYFLPTFAVRAALGAALLFLLNALVQFAQRGNDSLGPTVLFVIVPLLAGAFLMHKRRLANDAARLRTRSR